MEEESYELLSSMSPKVKHCQKHFRKGTTVLALRKSLQRSTIFDKSIHTVNNGKVITVDICSTTTTESNSSRSSRLYKKLLNTTPILVSDSDSDSEDLKLLSLQNKSPKTEKQSENLCVIKLKEHSLLPKEKIENIKHWIDNVHESKIEDNTAYSLYSELSTIDGGENKNFVKEKTGRAISSTVIGPSSARFEELFKHGTECIPKKPEEHMNNDHNDQYCMDESFVQQIDVDKISSKQDVVDESYVSESTNISKSSQGNKTDGYKVTSDIISNTDMFNSSSPSPRNKCDQLIDKLQNKYSCTSSDKNLFNNVKSTYNDSHKGLQINLTNDSDVIENDSDDSFSVLNESLNTRLLKNKNQANSNLQNNNVLYETPKANKCITNKEKNINYKNGSEDISENELTSMLDDLYGKKWREKEDHVLPKTEPRKRMPVLNSLHYAKTERKAKVSILYKNPYLETEQLKSNNLLQSLQKSRLNNYMESPLIKRLNDFCDSDSDSKDFESKITRRVKLNFKDSDCENDNCRAVNGFQNIGSNDKMKCKYFKNNVESNEKTETKTKTDNGSDKENSVERIVMTRRLSLFELSLEERIRKKFNGIESGFGGQRNRAKKGGKIPLTNRTDAGSMKINEKMQEDKPKNTYRQLSDNTDSSVSSDDAWEKEISKTIHRNKPVNGKLSFLASLSATVPIYQCDMSARIYRNNFKLHKDQLLTKLFKLFNERVFENALPQDTLLEWNDRMRGTAGFCYCKKITRRTGAVERTARIVLSTKVIDAANRLRDTLVHEMCHAATWIVNRISDGHGPYWKSWAHKAMQTFPELPPIKRCHDYVINTKYTYKCAGCGYSIGRHTKSLDIERKRCGQCYGKFEVLLNKVSKKGETKSVPATPKKEATGFALFVKENYSAYKQDHLKHGDVMKLLGQKFQEMKLKTK